MFQVAGDRAGIGTVSGKVEISGDNHVKLVWESTAEAQLDSWLKA